MTEKDFKAMKARNAKAWRANNPEAHKTQQKKYRAANKGLINSHKARRRAAKLNATVSWGDKEHIERLYIVANWCSEHLGEAYQVDHIIPLQGDMVCGLHVENNLQVITAKDNQSKSNKFVDI